MAPGRRRLLRWFHWHPRVVASLDEASNVESRSRERGAGGHRPRTRATWVTDEHSQAIHGAQRTQALHCVAHREWGLGMMRVVPRVRYVRTSLRASVCPSPVGAGSRLMVGCGCGVIQPACGVAYSCTGHAYTTPDARRRRATSRVSQHWADTGTAVRGRLYSYQGNRPPGPRCRCRSTRPVSTLQTGPARTLHALCRLQTETPVRCLRFGPTSPTGTQQSTNFCGTCIE